MSTEEMLVHSTESITCGNVVSRLSSAVFGLMPEWAERTDLVMIVSNEVYDLYMMNAMQKGLLAIEYNYLECCGIPLLANPIVAPNEVVIKVRNVLEDHEINRLRTLGNKYVVVSETVLQNSYRHSEHSDFSLPFVVSFLVDAVLLSLLISLI